MENNNVYDVSDAVPRYIEKKKYNILRKIIGKPEENFEINKQHIEVLKRGLISSIASVELGYQDKTTNQKGEKKILIKYFGKNIDKRKRRADYKNFADSTKNTCDFLSGNEDFPKHYFFDTDKSLGGDFLGLEQIGDKTLHELSKRYNHDDMLDLVQRVLPYIIRFQINATRDLERDIRVGKIGKEIYNSIFKKRDSIERILDYSRAILGKDDINEINKDLRKKIINLSTPLRRIHEPRTDTFRVTHGDPIFKNILLLEKKNKYGFIDAEPTLGDPLLDLSALLSTPNIKLGPSDWDYLKDIFLLRNEKELEEGEIDAHSIRSKLVPTLKEWGVKFSDEEVPGNHSFYAIGTIFSRSARIRAKVSDLKKYYPERYERMQIDDPGIATTIEDMEKNMSLSLWEIITAPGKFNISRDEYVDNLIEFYNILKDEGIIAPPEKYFKNNKNGQTDYEKITHKDNRPFHRKQFNKIKIIKERTKQPGKPQKEIA